MIHQIDEAAHLRGRPHPDRLLGVVQALGHIVQTESTQILQKVLFDDQVADLLQTGLHDGIVGRQADGQQTELVVTTIHDVENVPEQVIIFPQLLAKIPQLTGETILSGHHLLVLDQELQTGVAL